MQRPAPSALNMEAHAKWTAWAALGSLTQGDARSAYISEVARLSNGDGEAGRKSMPASHPRANFRGLRLQWGLPCLARPLRCSRAVTRLEMTTTLMASTQPFLKDRVGAPLAAVSAAAASAHRHSRAPCGSGDPSQAKGRRRMWTRGSALVRAQRRPSPTSWTALTCPRTRG